MSKNFKKNKIHKSLKKKQNLEFVREINCEVGH